MKESKPTTDHNSLLATKSQIWDYRVRLISRFCFLLGILGTLLCIIAMITSEIESTRLWEQNYAHLLSRIESGRKLKLLHGAETSLEHALRLLERAPIIDGHNDLAFKIEFISGGGNISGIDLYNLPKDLYQTDITRLKEGRVGALFFSAYVDCYDFHIQTDSLKQTLDQIDLVKRIIAKYPKDFAFAKSTRDIKRITDTGRIASLIGLEGGHQIDSSMGALRMMYELGVRYMTLTHSCPTSWADSCDPPFLHNGLTADGARFIHEMNRLGMLVDISHVTPATMNQTILTSKAPVIFSHSSIYKNTNHPRNVPDAILKMIPEKDGIVMINFYKEYVRSPEDVGNKVGISRVVEHMIHVKQLIGTQYLGIGADFDGEIEAVDGLEDVSKYPQLIAKLIENGFTDSEIVGITGGNLLRVFEKVEQAAQEMQDRKVEAEEVGVDVVKQCPSTWTQQKMIKNRRGC
ncbi:membrane dipeptidase-domain-containing protein [Obelidium mucronatum]|nr:membrane dipeptidase-domain-containing protein [Obelidium mucronatum]